MIITILKFSCVFVLVYSSLGLIGKIIVFVVSKQKQNVAINNISIALTSAILAIL